MDTDLRRAMNSPPLSDIISGSALNILLRNIQDVQAKGGYGPVVPLDKEVLDHINLTAKSPLEGPNPPDPYPIRFVDLTELYSPRLRALVQSIDPSIVEGVYAAFPGPHYETPAEIAMVRMMGGHLVGMSTALEAIAARHLGAEVLAMSLVTNPAAGISGEPLDHAEVVATGRAAAERMGVLLHHVVLALA
jgi:purine-nucleoside phosphorylase